MNPRPPTAPDSKMSAPTDVFRLAFNNNPAMQSVTRVSDVTIVEVNDAFLKTLGFSREEVVGKSPMALNTWTDPKKLQDYAEQLRMHGFVRNYETELRARDGTRHVVLLSSDLMDVGGELHAVSTGVNITDRKETEAALQLAHERLRQTEERFSKAFHANPALVALSRLADGKFVSVNDTFLEMIGRSEAEVIGCTTVELGIYPEIEKRGEFLQRIKTEGFIRNHEHLMPAKDGRMLTLLISAELVELEGVPHVLTVGIDITARKEAEARLHESERQLRESEARFGTAYRACPVIMTVARLPEARYVEVNDAFTHYYGYTRTEALGRTSAELALWVDEAARDKFFAELKRKRSLRNVECDLRSRDGKVYAMQLSADIIEINREPHLLAFALDVTQRKQAEAELQKALVKERELSRLKTDFVSLVSHEFRTPLEVIMSSVDNLDRYQDRLPPAKRQQLLRTINKSVRRMSDMMEEVLLLGRMESNRVEFKPVAFDVTAFCRRLRDEMESATSGRCPIQLSLKRLPTKARGDESVIRHILTNLVANAVKYSPAGSPVKIEAGREKGDAVFRVIDRGCGIPAADQPRLFQAFHRAANVRHIPGTGLGLVIVQRCVTLHGGCIEVESAEGKGTTFTVRLPLFVGARTRTRA